MKGKADKRRKIFSREFKLEALKVMEEGRYTIAEAAKNLGVSEQSLYRWRLQLGVEAQDAFRGNGKMTSEQSRIRELESENRRLRMERDFLKKTAIYFAKEEE